MSYFSCGSGTLPKAFCSFCSKELPHPWLCDCEDSQKAARGECGLIQTKAENFTFPPPEIKLVYRTSAAEKAVDEAFERFIP
jgi:hypothetical protein